MKTKEFLDISIKAAQSAGEVIFKSLGTLSERDIALKQTSDFVTRVDKDAERTIIATIREAFPLHSFLAEESVHEPETEGFQWIIDPLDGTTNYIHTYPVFSISIALQHKREIIVGVIFDPLRKELFTAEKGTGAFLNGHPIAVSGGTALKDCLITTGFPFRRKDLIDNYLVLFKNIFLKASDLRRAGSAALDLAYLAAGRCDGFFEIGLSPWDLAAGSLLIKEAGGIISDFGGGGEYLRTGNVVAGTPSVHPELMREVRKVFKGAIDG